MTQLAAIEGTGEEISRYASEHPRDRFLLVAVDQTIASPGFDEKRWDELMARIESRRGKYPVLSDEALTTDSLYD